MATLLSPAPRRTRSILPAAVLLSLVLHLLLLAFIGGRPLQARRPAREIVVALQPAAEAPTIEAAPGQAAAKQLVAPSDQENDLVPDGRAFLSDRNNRVAQEMIARGVPNPGRPDGQDGSNPDEAAANRPSEAVPREKPVAEPPPSERAAEEERGVAEAQKSVTRDTPVSEPAPVSETGTRRAPRKLPGLDTLLASPSKVLGAGRALSPAAPLKPRTPESDPNRDLLRAPPPARGLLSGLRGTYDAIPDVAAGRLTLLNTKADRFAPFVRRVGTRVFENLLIEQRKQLDAPEILAARNFTTVRAVLDSSGRLRDLQIIDRSGSQAMDGTLLEALREAAFDPNPPPAAANADGEFEFIFRAQVVAGVTTGARGPQLHRVESRLQVGLN
jgi:TonB family protein